MLWQPPLPSKYTTMTDAELAAGIRARKAELGRDLIILGHHYQQDEVIQFADFTGDSYKLSQLAAERVKASGAKYVVFCGVHFMAESADILAPQGVAVILPDLGAGCSMADMATYHDTVEAWREIHEVVDSTNVRILPICYMNSSAAIKAFCGEHGGAVCTSSNCATVLEWALAGGTTPLPLREGQGEGRIADQTGAFHADVDATLPQPLPGREGSQIKILFLPDQHLGRNTAASMGYDIHTDMALWDPRSNAGMGGLKPADIERATFLLWKGHCSVHKLFRPEHVDQIRALWPDVTVIVHPECAHEVVLKADMTGSTEGIIKTIASAAAGTRWAVGTEVHMVNRLANEAAARGVTVRLLSDCQCLCTTMYRIDLPHLLWVLDQLAVGKVVNQITVKPEVKKWSLIALDRMLALAGSGKMTVSPAHATLD